MNFLGIENCKFKDAKFVILPIPYEETTSFGKGTENAPSAILRASKQIELFDHETNIEADKCNIFTAREVNFDGLKGEDAVNLIKSRTDEIINLDAVPIGIGGEHTISFGLVKSVLSRYTDLHLVHFDAHADMRSEYDGTPWSHACVIRRITELGVPYTSIGIRSISGETYKNIDHANYYFAHEIADNDGWMKKAIDDIKSKNIYVTLDIDVFDSSVVPDTGTPEPGGLNWYQVNRFLKSLLNKKRLCGADVVELLPSDSSRASDYLAAKLIYKVINYSLA